MKIAILLGHRNNSAGTISELCTERLKMLIKADRIFDFDKVILSGGVGLFRGKNNFSEASLMYRYLKERNFDLKKLILEERSNTTKENVKYTLEIADRLKAREIVVITSISHRQRKLLNPINLFKKRLQNHTDIKLSVYSEEL